MGKLHYRGTTHSQLPSNFFTPPEHLITLTHAHLLTYTHINTRARARARPHRPNRVHRKEKCSSAFLFSHKKKEKRGKKREKMRREKKKKQKKQRGQKEFTHEQRNILNHRLPNQSNVHITFNI